MSPKPHLFKVDDLWVCGADSIPDVGFGRTFQEAYADWVAQRRAAINQAHLIHYHSDHSDHSYTSVH